MTAFSNIASPPAFRLRPLPLPQAGHPLFPAESIWTDKDYLLNSNLHDGFQRSSSSASDDHSIPCPATPTPSLSTQEFSIAENRRVCVVDDYPSSNIKLSGDSTPVPDGSPNTLSEKPKLYFVFEGGTEPGIQQGLEVAERLILDNCNVHVTAHATMEGAMRAWNQYLCANRQQSSPHLATKSDPSVDIHISRQSSSVSLTVANDHSGHVCVSYSTQSGQVPPPMTITFRSNLWR